MIDAMRTAYRALVPEQTRKHLYKARHPIRFHRRRSAVFPSPKGSFSLKPFDRHQCIFIHVPKSAGTSISNSLFGFHVYHYSAMDYRVIYGSRTFERYFKFAFIRNPWDRLLSSFCYMKAGGWDENDRLWADRHLAHYSSFESFVDHWLTPESIYSHMHFVPQHEFLCDGKGRIAVDYLGRFENLQNDYAVVSRRLATGVELQHRNAGRHGDYQRMYNKRMRRKVAEIYQTDIEIFGYEFDGHGLQSVGPRDP